MSTVTDIDGNVYQTVVIGEQEWMAENLRVTKLNDEIEIPLSIDEVEWIESTVPLRTTYADNEGDATLLGRLYNWYAVNSRRLAPEGWHVPTQADWDALMKYAGGSDVAGGHLKEDGGTWNAPNTGADNILGFTAIGSGYRFTSIDGSSFIGALDYCFFWAASVNSARQSEAEAEMLVYDDARFHRISSIRSMGYSVRCVKNPPLPSEGSRTVVKINYVDILKYGLRIQNYFGDMDWSARKKTTEKWNFLENDIMFEDRKITFTFFGQYEDSLLLGDAVHDFINNIQTSKEGIVEIKPAHYDMYHPRDNWIGRFVNGVQVKVDFNNSVFITLVMTWQGKKLE